MNNRKINMMTGQIMKVTGYDYEFVMNMSFKEFLDCFIDCMYEDGSLKDDQ